MRTEGEWRELQQALAHILTRYAELFRDDVPDAADWARGMADVVTLNLRVTEMAERHVSE